MPRFNEMRLLQARMNEVQSALFDTESAPPRHQSLYVTENASVDRPMFAKGMDLLLEMGHPEQLRDAAIKASGL